MGRLITGLLLLTATFAVVAAQQMNTNMTRTPLSEEQIAVYRAFLGHYQDGAHGVVNLANKTTSLELSASDQESCAKGIELQGLTKLRSTDPQLSPEVVAGRNFKLVESNEQASAVRNNDPSDTIRAGKSVKDAVEAAFASGLLELSEIAFDRAHRYAVLNFSFSCGRLCGHGGTLVFRKVKGRWEQTDRPRSISIS